MGRLSTTWDLSGSLQSYSGAPVLLGGASSSNPVADDPAVAARVAELRAPLALLGNTVVGELLHRGLGVWAAASRLTNAASEAAALLDACLAHNPSPARSAGELVTPLFGHADRNIVRNQETNTGNLVCAALRFAAETGIVSPSSGGLCGRQAWPWCARTTPKLGDADGRAAPSAAANQLPLDAGRGQARAVCQPWSACGVRCELGGHPHRHPSRQVPGAVPRLSCSLCWSLSPREAAAAGTSTPCLPLNRVSASSAGNVTLGQINSVLSFGNT